VSETLLLVDLASLVHPLFHVSGKEPDQDWTSQQAIARIRAAAHGHPHAAICCEGGRSFRKDLDAGYKANRPEVNEPLQHQMRLTIEALKADGFPCWSVKGMEADDIIAAATKQALACDGDVLILSDDKDILQLVSDKVTVKRWRDGEMRTQAVVMERLHVRPDQMLDYLCLVGDTSDNIKGATGIGGVKAAQLLATFGSIAEIYKALDAGTAKLTEGIANSLVEFRDRWPKVRDLIALRTDVEIPFHEIATERAVPALAELPPMFDVPFEEDARAKADAPKKANATPSPQVASATQPVAEREQVAARVEPVVYAPSSPEVGRTATASQALIPAPAEWERGLEPRSMSEAKDLAQMMFASRLFSAYGTPQGVLASVLAGRELGLSAMASLGILPLHRADAGARHVRDEAQRRAGANVARLHDGGSAAVRRRQGRERLDEVPDRYAVGACER
jgi:5'-3' exonuclease